MWRTELLGARPFRLALAFALAISTATIIAFSLIYLQVSKADRSRVGGILAQEAYRNVDASEARLSSALAARQTENIRRIDYLALFDADGRRVLGNILQFPPIAADGKPHEIPAGQVVTTGKAPQASIFVGRRREDGGVLLLGRNLADTFEIENTLLRALAVALAPTILLIMAIGAWFARRALSRLESIHGSITRIMEGDIKSRLPVPRDRDHDEIDRIARAVNLMLDEIARLLDQLKSVGDNIAHDLRAPLTVVRHKVERALGADPDSLDARAHLAAALSELDRAAVTISALLRISAVENGPRDTVFRVVDIAAVCVEAAEFYAPLAEDKSIDLSVRADVPVWVRGDEDLLREAITNLIDNAIKYTPATGAVRVIAKVCEGRPHLEVSDTGPGIPPHDRERIFDRFYRIAKGETSPGHGLGLNIAKTIAELHGFTLAVESGGPGARFVMRGADKAPLALLRH